VPPPNAALFTGFSIAGAPWNRVKPFPAMSYTTTDGNLTRTALVTGSVAPDGMIGLVSSRSPEASTGVRAVSGVDPEGPTNMPFSQIGAPWSGEVEPLSSTIRYSFWDFEISMLKGTGTLAPPRPPPACRVGSVSSGTGALFAAASFAGVLAAVRFGATCRRNRLAGSGGSSPSMRRDPLHSQWVRVSPLTSSSA